MQTQEGDDLERLTSHQKGFLGGRVAPKQKRQSGAYHQRHHSRGELKFRWELSNRTLKESSWKFLTAHLFKFHWPVLGVENIYMGSVHH